MIGDSQRLQGCGGCGVRRAISSTPSKVTRLQGLQGLRGSLSDKFQRYSPSFDIIIIIIILEVDIRGCEVARVSRFRRAISTHITCHIYAVMLLAFEVDFYLGKYFHRLLPNGGSKLF